RTRHGGVGVPSLRCHERHLATARPHQDVFIVLAWWQCVFGLGNRFAWDDLHNCAQQAAIARSERGEGSSLDECNDSPDTGPAAHEKGQDPGKTEAPDLAT